MRSKPQILAAILCLAVGALRAEVTVQYFDAAGSSFPTLSVPVGVRAIGMGGAFTAAADDASSLEWNPAGLAKMSSYQLGLEDNQWQPTLGLRQEVLSYGQSLAPGSGLGASVNYFGLGSLQSRDSSGALLGSSNAYMLAGSGGYARSFLDHQRLKLGASLELGAQSLFDSVQSEMDASLGLLYDLTPALVAGASLEHLGIGIGTSPSENLNAGLALKLFEQHLTLALDLQAPDRAQPLLKGGFELRVSALRLRAGYRQVLGAEDGDVQSGITAGLGFKVGVVLLDYAFVSYGDLSNVNRLALTLDLPHGFFQPTVVGAEGTVELAKAYYDKAVGLENGGDTLKALIEYQRCTESYPEKAKAAPEKFYLTAKDKVVSLQAEMDKRGGSGQVNKLVKEYLSKAQEALKALRYVDAIASLQEAKQIDPSNPVIAQQLVEAQGGLEQSLLVYRNAARAAEKAQKLDQAVEDYRKLLAVAPADEEALAYLTFHRKDLEALLGDIHRKGIYAFVGGRLEEAIKDWEAGEALDYFGDVDFKRDIEKARKRLGLHDEK